MTTSDVVCGVYRHYKGMLYEVYGVALHTEMRVEVVVCRALYGEYGLFVRPLEMFCETVEVDGKKVARFECVQAF